MAALGGVAVFVVVAVVVAVLVFVVAPDGPVGTALSVPLALLDESPLNAGKIPPAGLTSPGSSLVLTAVSVEVAALPVSGFAVEEFVAVLVPLAAAETACFASSFNCCAFSVSDRFGLFCIC